MLGSYSSHNATLHHLLFDTSPPELMPPSFKIKRCRITGLYLSATSHLQVRTEIMARWTCEMIWSGVQRWLMFSVSGYSVPCLQLFHYCTAPQFVCLSFDVTNLSSVPPQGHLVFIIYWKKSIYLSFTWAQIFTFRKLINPDHGLIAGMCFSCCRCLPVSMLKFTATVQKGAVVFDWQINLMFPVTV